MKTAEDILKHIDSTFIRAPYGISRDNREKIKSLIRDVQNDAYNHALEDAAENAACEYEKDYLTGEIDKQSILKLKK